MGAAAGALTQTVTESQPFYIIFWCRRLQASEKNRAADEAAAAARFSMMFIQCLFRYSTENESLNHLLPSTQGETIATAFGDVQRR